MDRSRLLIADDHTLLVEGFQRILEPYFDIVGVAENGQSLVKLAIELQPDAVLLDISMPVMSGFEAARLVRRDVPSANLIFVTMHADREFVEEALRIGASTYVLKRSAVSELAEATPTSAEWQDLCHSTGRRINRQLRNQWQRTR